MQKKTSDMIVIRDDGIYDTFLLAYKWNHDIKNDMLVKLQASQKTKNAHWVQNCPSAISNIVH